MWSTIFVPNPRPFHRSAMIKAISPLFRSGSRLSLTTPRIFLCPFSVSSATMAISLL